MRCVVNDFVLLANQSDESWLNNIAGKLSNLSTQNAYELIQPSDDHLAYELIQPSDDHLSLIRSKIQLKFTNRKSRCVVNGFRFLSQYIWQVLLTE